MMNTKVTILFLFAVLISGITHAKDKMLSKLDDAIENRDYYQQRKVERIDSLRGLLSPNMSADKKLEIYNRLFDEFITFKYDSAMVYVEKTAQLFENSADYDIKSLIEINRAHSLATSGHFSNAADILKKIDSSRLSPKIKDEYFTICEWTYGVWAEYSDKRTVAPGLFNQSLLYLDSLIEITNQSDIRYQYRLGEKALRLANFKDAERYYSIVVNEVPAFDRLYAQAAYALALTYKNLGVKDRYKEWLVNAAISDQVIPLKENLALQQLAAFIKEENGDLGKANSYLRIALDDAVFYNNRLRMLEVAEKIPGIASLYQDKIKQQNRRLTWLVSIVGLLLLLLGCAMIFVYRQQKKVYRAKDALSELNEKLNELNVQLSNTNTHREQYVSLYIDLCAAYIEKLNRFPMVLKLKVKQLSDLSSVADKYVRPSDAETREMFFNFDTAFLRLYPNFIEEFNNLLQIDKQITPKKGELLNTDLRIYALVRMGIVDSNKIASLLFLSPQTIFNHRTQVRNRAKNRETFEANVSRIADLI